MLRTRHQYARQLSDVTQKQKVGLGLLGVLAGAVISCALLGLLPDRHSADLAPVPAPMTTAAP